MTDTLRRALRWLRRFRHRRGYGIHSPFAFTFVTDVVYERSAYYAYAPLHRRRAHAGGRLREKDDRLLLRLANAVGPATIVAVSNHLGVTEEYLRAGRPSAHFIAATPYAAAATIAAAPPVDLFYLDTNGSWETLWNAAARRRSDRACFVVRGIHRTRRDLTVWRRLTADSRVRVTFDLHDFGIAFFEARLVKQDYVINYF